MRKNSTRLKAMSAIATAGTPASRTRRRIFMTPPRSGSDHVAGFLDDHRNDAAGLLDHACDANPAMIPRVLGGLDDDHALFRFRLVGQELPQFRGEVRIRNG